MRWSWIAVLLILPLGGCSKNNSPSVPSSPAFSLSGTWSGDLLLQTTSTRMVWTLAQSGNSVTGQVVVVLPSGTVLMNGVLSGTLSGMVLPYTIAVNPSGIPSQPSCTGQLTGSVTAANGTPPTLTGSYSLVSSTCNTPFSSGSFTLAKSGS